MFSEKLKDLINNLPQQPGVYLMKNAKGEVIYVGKAVVLKNRVRQYFQSSQHMDPKVRIMVSHIEEFEYIVTDSEMEALILENNLIKEYKPFYNVLLKDDKTYPYIKVLLTEYFPRLVKVRKVEKDGARYFGPYTNVFLVDETLEMIRETYKIRTCKRDIRRSIERKERPCLEYFIKRCNGPCLGIVDETKYMETIQEIMEILDGKNNLVMDSLKNKMQKAAAAQEYEEAAGFRDRIISLESVSEKQKVVTKTGANQDYVGVDMEEDMACIYVFFVRGGKIVGKEHFIFEKTRNSSKEEILGAFMKQFYMGLREIPREILVSVPFEDMALMEVLLGQNKGQKVQIHQPLKGEKRHILSLAEKNAAETILQKKNLKLAKLERTVGVMKELQEFLNLDRIPEKIEAYDISNIQGVDSVGGQVVFVDGVKAPKLYRRYKIKSVEGPNDYASMEEIIRRRIKHGELPDVILMDGGKGQVSSAKKVLSQEGLDIPVLGMYKDERHRTAGLTTETEIIPLSKHSLLYQFIARVQDEVHRFALSYHRSLRDKGLYRSLLDDIPGVGKKRKMELLSHFKSIHLMKEATVEELASVNGMNRQVAEKIYQYFRREDHAGEESIHQEGP